MQTAVAFVGGLGHITHAAPHFAIELSATHIPSHKWNPETHAIPHALALHVAVPCNTGMQRAQCDVRRRGADCTPH